jgi:hypothetical protein
VNYPYEALSFIIFHELLHNYFLQQNIHIPYEFVEAACDVVGNYGTLKYAKISDKYSLTEAIKQAELNENLYHLFNYYIDSINQCKQPADAKNLCNRCNISTHKLLTNANDFQKDRFDYTVNTAYLLKNINYCKEYFLLKRVILKAGSIEKFLEILRRMPPDIISCIDYLEEYLNQFILYADPSSTSFTLTLPEKDTGEFTLSVFSIYGKMVRQSTFTAYNYQFNLTDLPNGMYFYTLTGDKSNYSGKIQINIE